MLFLMATTRSPRRHHTYTAILLLTLAAVVATYLIERSQGQTDPFNAVVLPLLAASLGFLTLGHLFYKLNLRRVETGFFIVSALAYFGKLGFTLFGIYAPLERANELSQVYIWTPFIYALAFLVGTPRAGLYRASSVYLVASGLSLVALWQGVTLTGYRLSEYYLGNLVLLALLYFVGSLRTRIDELQVDLGETTRLATQDFLTGVSNRRLLEVRLRHEFELYRRYGTPVSIMLFDIDNFKTFNDSYGHIAGDEALKAVAETVQRELRPTDAFGRWGGEEFLVIAAHTDARHATLLAERLRGLIETTRVPGERSITASFGVAMYRSDPSLEALVSRADAALYDAKIAGKNRVELDTLGGLPLDVVLPRLSYPFPEVYRSPGPEVVAAVSVWLATWQLGPVPDYLRRHMARSFSSLAATLHPHADSYWLVLLGKWYCWAFLHDDRCDASELGRNPARLEGLTKRLAELFGGAAVRSGDEPLGHALVNLRGDLLALGGAAWLAELGTELGRYFSALEWEAQNRAEALTPSLERYLVMRPITVGLQIDDLFSLADGVSVNTKTKEPLVSELNRLANEVVCWSNDLISLDKELQQAEVHNLVQVLQHARGLSLQEAVAQAKAQHDEVLSQYLATERRAREQLSDWSSIEPYLRLLQARMRGIHDWAEVSGRYR